MCRLFVGFVSELMAPKAAGLREFGARLEWRQRWKGELKKIDHIPGRADRHG